MHTRAVRGNKDPEALCSPMCENEMIRLIYTHIYTCMYTVRGNGENEMIRLRYTHICVHVCIQFVGMVRMR